MFIELKMLFHQFLDSLQFLMYVNVTHPHAKQVVKCFWLKIQVIIAMYMYQIYYMYVSMLVPMWLNYRIQGDV